MDKFWMVLRENGGGAPQRRHNTLKEAQDEAARLAKQTDTNYYILETIGKVKIPEIQYIYEDIK